MESWVHKTFENKIKKIKKMLDVILHQAKRNIVEYSHLQESNFFKHLIFLNNTQKPFTQIVSKKSLL
jgi:septation ring formation regulator EzrA